jgi:putative tricarboxylic transport membrane protein
MKKSNNIILIFWVGLSLFTIFFSYKYGLGGFHNPGPGLMPFLLGVLLLIVSLYLLTKSLFKVGGQEKVDKVVEEGQGRINYGKIGFVLASLFFYGLFLEKLGYLIVTFLTMVLLFWGVGIKRWPSLLFASGLTVLITYFLFTYLGVRFPAGILKFVGIG